MAETSFCKENAGYIAMAGVLVWFGAVVHFYFNKKETNEE